MTRSGAKSTQAGERGGTAESQLRSRTILFRNKVMRAAKLNSSMISRVAYDEDAEALSIWFKETGRYIYYGVPRAIYEALRRAPSAGRFFNECIRRRYRCAPDPERRRFRPTG